MNETDAARIYYCGLCNQPTNSVAQIAALQAEVERLRESNAELSRTILAWDELLAQRDAALAEATTAITAGLERLTRRDGRVPGTCPLCLWTDGRHHASCAFVFLTTPAAERGRAMLEVVEALRKMPHTFRCNVSVGGIPGSCNCPKSALAALDRLGRT